MVDAVFTHQDSLGLMPWGRLARVAGVRDTAAVTRCALDTASVARIRAGSDVGGLFQVRSTPSVIVNGWLLSGTPSNAELERIIQAVLARKAPFDSLGNAI